MPPIEARQNDVTRPPFCGSVPEPQEAAPAHPGGGATRFVTPTPAAASRGDEEIDYDTSIELERAGGAILELKPMSWRKIAVAP